VGKNELGGGSIGGVLKKLFTGEAIGCCILGILWTFGQKAYVGDSTIY